MIREHILNLHRRLFGRCQGCGKRLKAYRPRILGYEWRGAFRSEAGMWHARCIEFELAGQRRDEIIRGHRTAR
jgi:hypothetical protein